MVVLAAKATLLERFAARRQEALMAENRFQITGL
jgi:hypothetical protein